MRISDWSSDVCSSDLPGQSRHRPIREAGQDVRDGDKRHVHGPARPHGGAGHHLCRRGRKAYLSLADEAKNLTAQLKLATAQSGNFGQAQADVKRIADATRNGLAEDRKSTSLTSSH